jgi:hypothetical protein
MSKEGRPPHPEADDRPATDPVSSQREAVIRAEVIKALGRPADLLRVTVVPLWSDYFRVNLVTGADPASITIPNSFFVSADAAGAILTATPPILKVY